MMRLQDRGKKKTNKLLFFPHSYSFTPYLGTYSGDKTNKRTKEKEKQIGGELVQKKEMSQFCVVLVSESLLDQKADWSCSPTL